MKKLVLFLGVLLFSVKSAAVCPVYPIKGQCQVASNVAENGQVVFKQSYCTGDFPYCETFGGDCCSEPSYRSEGGWGCCDSEEYVGHIAGTITPGGTQMSVFAYKCCSIAEYGKNSTFYFDKQEHVHCCGGKVYNRVSSDETTKTCCNHEFDSEGNVTQYYTVATVMGVSEGQDQMCCKTIGDAPGKYRATAYWDGNAYRCCEGTAYKSAENSYGCCQGTRGPEGEKTHKTVAVSYGGPGNVWACCDIEKYGDKPEAYWNGSSGSCCKGKPYKASKTANGEYIYACCEGADGEESEQTHGVVSVQGTSDGIEACCPYYSKYADDNKERGLMAAGIMGDEGVFCTPNELDCEGGSCEATCSGENDLTDNGCCPYEQVDICDMTCCKYGAGSECGCRAENAEPCYDDVYCSTEYRCCIGDYFMQCCEKDSVCCNGHCCSESGCNEEGNDCKDIW